MLGRNPRPDQQYNWHDMATEVKLDAIIEALEMADDSIASYLVVETGEVHSITEEEVRPRGGSADSQRGFCRTGSVRRLN